MEFVNCGNCMCWNQDHWAVMEDANGKRETKNTHFGICQRRAPVISSQGSKANSNYFVIAFKKIFPIGIIKHTERTRVLPFARFDEGCWEGIKKDG